MPSYISQSSSFSSSFSSYFSSYFTSYLNNTRKDKKYDISLLVISFITFCALSAFCWFIIAVNFTGWFFITVIGGFITKCRQELFKSLIGKKTSESEKQGIMLDHTLDSRHRINPFEDINLFGFSSSKERKGSLPSIPSYRTSNKSSSPIDKYDSILSFDFSFPGLTDGDKNSNNNKKNNNIKSNKKNIPVLLPSEYSTKRNEKRTKNVKQRHVPDIPSQLGPNRQQEWKSNVNYYPSERHSHQPKSKLSVTEKMIESTAAYRVGRKCHGWINGDSEEYTIRQKDSKKDYVSYDDPFCSREPIKELNVRLDQERPKITKQERRTYNKSPSISLQYARQYLTILLSVKKRMNI